MAGDDGDGGEGRFAAGVAPGARAGDMASRARADEGKAPGPEEFMEAQAREISALFDRFEAEAGGAGAPDVAARVCQQARMLAAFETDAIAPELGSGSRAGERVGELLDRVEAEPRDIDELRGRMRELRSAVEQLCEGEISQLARARERGGGALERVGARMQAAMRELDASELA